MATQEPFSVIAALLMLNLRDAFALPASPNAVELRAFTHGLMPKTVPAMMQRFADDWQQYGVDAWNEVPNHWRPGSNEPVGWWTLPAYLGDTFIAPMLGAAPGTCIMQPNANWTMQCLLSDPSIFTERKDVIVSAGAFPSVLHSTEQWSSLQHYNRRVIPLSNERFLDQKGVLDAISADTALVALSHVGFTTGEKLPDSFIQAVVQKTHAQGGLVAMDGYHSTCSMPIDVVALGVDMYFGGLLKEGCGSSGNGYVYIRPSVSITPRISGWFADADPFAFAAHPKPHPEARMRFLGGTTAIASLYHAVEGLRLFLDVGLHHVRKDSLEKTAYCIERVDRFGLPLRSPREPERRSAMVIFEVEQADRLCTYLKHQSIFTDSRQGRYLRMAPFVWNTLSELERTFEVLAGALATGTYRTLSLGTRHGPVT